MGVTHLCPNAPLRTADGFVTKEVATFAKATLARTNLRKYILFLVIFLTLVTPEQFMFQYFFVFSVSKLKKDIGGSICSFFVDSLMKIIT